MKNFLLSLQFIFKPGYWMMNYPYNKEWDVKLNELLDKYEFTKIDSYHATLNNTTIWVANYPYAYMLPTIVEKIRPSRLTIQRAYKKLTQIDKIKLSEKINKLS